MNKLDLTKVVSSEMRLPLQKAGEVVDMVFNTMSKALAAGDRIEVRGFGSFSVRYYKEYMGRNPKTGEEVEVRRKDCRSLRSARTLRRG